MERLKWDECDHLPSTLELVHGQPVMVTKNIRGDIFVSNGTRAVFKGVRRDDAGDVIALRLQTEMGDRIELERVRGRISLKGPKKIVTRDQFPVRPAFAATIHKSQGLTLDAVLLSTDNMKPSPQLFSMLYVALTRVRSLEDLFLATPLTKSLLASDPPQDLVEEMSRIIDVTKDTVQAVEDIII